MRYSRKGRISILFWISVVWLGCISFARGGGQVITGGPCTYKDYPGTATITSITPAPNTYGAARQKYVVKFSFATDAEIQEEFARAEGKEFELRLVNSTYPGPKFLEKYDIRVGKVFDCVMKVIVKGTCSPRVFEFPSIRLDDYFEN